MSPSVGRARPGGAVDQRRLARPVGAEQAEELALADLERHALQRLRAGGVALDQVADLERRSYGDGVGHAAQRLYAASESTGSGSASRAVTRPRHAARAAAPRAPRRSRPPAARRRPRRRADSRRPAPTTSESPWARRSSVRAVASAATTARPSAPPTCTSGVDQPGGEPGVALGGAGHGQRHQRREGEAGAQAEREHRGQQVDHVAGVHRGAREPGESQRDQHEARDQHRPAAVAQDQLVGEAQREQADQQRHGQECEADLDRVVAEHALHVERTQEEHPEHAGHHQRADRVGAGHVARAEDAQRHQRVGRARLAREEAGEQRQRQPAEAERVRRRPSPGRWSRRSCRRRASARRRSARPRPGRRPRIGRFPRRRRPAAAPARRWPRRSGCSRRRSSAS